MSDNSGDTTTTTLFYSIGKKGGEGGLEGLCVFKLERKPSSLESRVGIHIHVCHSRAQPSSLLCLQFIMVGLALRQQGPIHRGYGWLCYTVKIAPVHQSVRTDAGLV